MLVKAATDAREFSLLWLVFAILEEWRAKGTISAGYFLANTIIPLAIWFAGAYIEVRLSRKGTTS
jgi:hypothetical protein